MIEIRIHGRGGQGNVVAAYLLAAAGFEIGQHCQAFPSFGAERRGAPVTAFVRLSAAPIRRRCEVGKPAFLIVQDAGLLHLPATLDGLREGGGVVVNTTRPESDIAAVVGGRPVVAIAASSLAQDILGKPVPNVALLAAFLAVTGLLPQEALMTAVAHRFKGDIVTRNHLLIETAAKLVPANAWREVSHA